MKKPALCAVLAILALGVTIPSAVAQLDPAFAMEQGYSYSTGVRYNPDNVTQMMDRHVIAVAGAPSLRVFFAKLVIGPGDHVKVTSTLDGNVHEITPNEAAKWLDSSAFFNGDTLVVELWAAPGSLASYEISHLLVGIPVAHPESFCGADDRMPSSFPKVARFLNSGGTSACTGWMASSDDCAITAGHCTGSFAVTAEFDVPPSSGSGALQHPATNLQYPISQINSNGGQGIGDDWAVVKILPNNLGQSASQQRGFFVLRSQFPAPGETIRITGHGSDGGVDNQVQQTHTGPFAFANATNVNDVQLCYSVDTTGGNSGSPIIHEASGEALGVHTHAGCSATAGSCNSGTSIQHLAFINAWSAMCSVGPQFTLDIQTTGGGAGDLSVTLTNVPAGTAEGFTLVSFDTSMPLGVGASVLDLRADLFTFQILTLPATPGDLFHWTYPAAGGQYPNVSFSVPLGTIQLPAGTSFDSQAAALGAGFTFIDQSNAARTVL